MKHLKPSEVFQQAIDDKVRQVRGQLDDGKGGYCAKGLLLDRLQDRYRIDELEDALEAKFRSRKLFRPLRPIAYANDVRRWKWEQFRDFFKARGM